MSKEWKKAPELFELNTPTLIRLKELHVPSADYLTEIKTHNKGTILYIFRYNLFTGHKLFGPGCILYLPECQLPRFKNWRWKEVQKNEIMAYL